MLPDSGSIGGFFSVEQNVGGQKWSLIDLGGDKALELVQFTQPGMTPFSVFPDAENGYWKVYKLTASGYSAQAVEFELTSGPTARGFFAKSNSGAGGWQIIDIDEIVSLTSFN